MPYPKIRSVEALDGYRVKLCYETEEVKVFDVLPYISGSWYGELRNGDYFKSVHLTPDGQGIEWGNGQDIAPHELYDSSERVPVNSYSAFKNS